MPRSIVGSRLSAVPTVLGQNELPPLVYTAPKIKDLMLDESGTCARDFWKIISTKTFAMNCPITSV